MNRYDVASVAKFNPLSYQEIMAAPLAMRQKHDNAIAAAEALRIKTDPYSKHYNRALELKQQMDNEIAKNVDILNKEGYNPTTFQNITKLNRQYNDMISPTGEIGQINAENINIKKINEEYDKLGKEKNWGQETIDYWKNKALKEYNEKPLYDANGKILTYSGPEGVVNKVDYNKRLHELASSAKMSTTEFANAVTKLGMDEKSGYNVANKNSEAHKLGDNYAGVKAAYDTLKREMYDPTSEVYKSMKYENRDPSSLLDILKTQSNIYNQNIKSDEYSNDINPFGPGPGSGDGKEKTPMLNDAIQDPNSIKNLNKNTGEIDFSQIGSKVYKGSFDNLFKKVWEPKHGDGKVPNHYKDVLSPIQQKFYETAAKRLIASKRLPKDADLNNTANAEKIGFYMKNYMKFPTVATDIIRADVAIDNQLFSGNLASKDQNSRNATLTQDLRQTKDGKPLRTMLDVESGGKVKLEEGDTIDYLGVESPINYSSYGFENKNEQSVMGHRAQVLDSKGNVKANVVISRTPNEMDDPTFKKMYEISHTYKNGLNNLGNWVRPTGNYSKSKELSKAKVRVNDNNTFQIQIDGYPISKELNNEEFIRDMNKIMEY